MMQKGIGAVLLLAAALYLGMTLARCAGQRVRELGAFCRLIADIRDGIAGMQLPLDVIFTKQNHGVLAENGFFTYLTEAAEAGTDAPLQRALERCTAAGVLALEEEDIACIAAFAQDLGHGDCQTELGRCDYYLAQLEKRYAEAEKTTPAYIRMMRILPLSAVGLLIILLI